MCTCIAILEASLWKTLNKAFSTDKCCPHETKFKHYILKRVVLTSITVGILFNVTNFGLKNWL